MSFQRLSPRSSEPAVAKPKAGLLDSISNEMKSIQTSINEIEKSIVGNSIARRPSEHSDGDLGKITTVPSSWPPAATGSQSILRTHANADDDIVESSKGIVNHALFRNYDAIILLENTSALMDQTKQILKTSSLCKSVLII